MDYGKIDVLSTSQGCPAADASLGLTYRTIRGHLENVWIFWGTSLGRPRDIILPSGFLVKNCK